MTDPPAPAGIRVVCFDLGGVVVRICRTWQEACARASVPVRDHARFDTPELKSRRRTITDDYMAGRLTCEQYWRDIAGATAGLYEPHEIRAVHLAWTMDDYAGIAAAARRWRPTGFRC